MRKTAFAELVSSLWALTPQQLAQLDTAVSAPNAASRPCSLRGGGRPGLSALRLVEAVSVGPYPDWRATLEMR
jgi:hypothetical protein